MKRARRQQRSRAVVAALIGVALSSAEVGAHAMAPSLLELTEASVAADRVRVQALWKTPALAERGVALDPVFPPDCSRESLPVRSLEGSALVERSSLQCANGLAGKRIAIRDLEHSGTAVLVRIALLDGVVLRRVLASESDALTVPARSGPVEVALDYLELGALHIASGADHLVFLLALVLLAPGLRSLLVLATAFTVGHSLTLGLAALDLVSPSERLVELLIAASILALAVRLASPDPAARESARLHWAAACGFGLLHGFGFAGALRAAGLPSSDIPLALLSFNLGIELGQIAFILAAVAVTQLAARLVDRWAGDSPFLLAIPSHAIGALAACWIFQRLLPTG